MTENYFGVIVGIPLVLLIFQLAVPLIDTLKEINKSLTAYSDCISEYIDKAFIGEYFNFTKCYLEKRNTHSNVKCEIKDNKTVICHYKSKIYVFKL